MQALQIFIKLAIYRNNSWQLGWWWCHATILWCCRYCQLWLLFEFN